MAIVILKEKVNNVARKLKCNEVARNTCDCWREIQSLVGNFGSPTAWFGQLNHVDFTLERTCESRIWNDHWKLLLRIFLFSIKGFAVADYLFIAHLGIPRISEFFLTESFTIVPRKIYLYSIITKAERRSRWSIANNWSYWHEFKGLTFRWSLSDVGTLQRSHSARDIPPILNSILKEPEFSCTRITLTWPSVKLQ